MRGLAVRFACGGSTKYGLAGLNCPHSSRATAHPIVMEMICVFKLLCRCCWRCHCSRLWLARRQTAAVGRATQEDPRALTYFAAGGADSRPLTEKESCKCCVAGCHSLNENARPSLRRWVHNTARGFVFIILIIIATIRTTH